MSLLKATQPLALLCAFFMLTFSGSLKAQSIKINEILANNSNVNIDNFGESDDWVELYNPTAFPINIGGMYLTDDLTNLSKWYIPSNQPQQTTIPEFGFLLIWCDDQPLQGPTHAAFKLSASGESVALVAANGTTIIDSYTFGPQSANVSVGRQLDGQTPWVLFASPSPKDSNEEGVLFANMPVASQNGGHYSNSFTVSLTTTTPNATIYYTTNGSEPTSNDAQYTSPIEIDETTVLRARAFANNTVPSRTMTHTYLFNIQHEFPIFCLSTDHEHIWGEDEGIYENFLDDIEQPVHVELYEADGSFGFRQDLGIQIHGRHSQTFPHKGLSFRARNQYGSDKILYPLFPDMPFDEYGSFILRASGNDWKRMLCRDAMASSLIREMADVDSLIKDPDLVMQGYRPTVVYLNGEYFGIHNLREKLDHRYLKTHYGIEEEDVDIVHNESGVQTGTGDAWDDFITFVEDSDLTDPADLAEVKNNIDIGHFFDYFLFNIYIDNNDWPGNNNRHWRVRQPGEKWRYMVYDLDGSFGLSPLSDDYNSGDWTSPSLEMVMSETETYGHNAPHSTVLIRRLMENDTLRAQFINRMADFLNVLFTPERVIGRIDEFQALYQNEIPQHDEFWWDNDDNWEEDMDIARLFATHRNEFVFDMYKEFFTEDIEDVVDLTLKAQPAAGGEIHLNTINLYEEQYPWTGTYFSGIDVPLHTVPNPGYIFTGWTPANLGTNPVTTMHLTGNGNITANYVLGSTQIGNIVINEINYHSPAACDAGDWVELYNAGSTSVNLSGWFLEDESGNYFNIPANTHLEAGGFLVLVQDAAKFATVHPQVSNFIGGFGASLTGGFGLNNAGEWISINNANRSFQDTVHYLDIAPWPTAADGNGPSLELKNPTLDNALAQSWFVNVGTKGSPGEQNQGVLYLGPDLTTCDPLTSFTLDASFVCFNCTYLWSNGATLATIQVTPPVGNHTYSVTVTDNDGLTQTDQIAITVFALFNMSATVQETCVGEATGSIDLELSGSNAFTYQWSTGASTADIYNLAAGVYSVTVTDDHSCTKTQTLQILNYPALQLQNDLTEILCYGDLGSINLTPSGGTAPYSFSWSNGATTEDLSALSAGNYTVTLTDAKGCDKQKSFHFDAPPSAPLAGTFEVEPACFGVTEGEITVDMTGGTGDYYYEWSNGVSGDNDDEVENLLPGSYQLTVTDENDCTWFGTTVVQGSSTMHANFSVSPLNCFGDNTGAVSLSVNGGQAPYDYVWGNQQTGATIQNLPGGMITVTITDAIECQHYDSIYITQPASLAPISNIQAVSCFGGSDGIISVQTSAGIGTIQYAWATGDSGATIDGLAAGTYTVTISDSNNCEHIEQINLPETPPVTQDLDISPVSCFGGTDGNISVFASGGTGVFNYLWNNGATNAELDDIPAGTYSLTITDSNNCQSTETVLLPEPSPITLAVAANPVSCFGGNDGNISITASGGTGTLSYEWSNGADEADMDDLTVGNYTITITDSNDCENIETIYIPQAPAIVPLIQTAHVTCFDGSNGMVTVVAVGGGTGAMNYVWSNGATGSAINNLQDGIYTLTITDANNCTDVNQVVVAQPTAIVANISTESVSCSGGTDGSITLSAAGGVGGFTYEWNNGATGNSLANLAAGSYVVTITDNNQCEQTAQINLQEATPMVTAVDISAISCNAGANGSITLAVTGGAGNYQYHWSTGASGNTVANLPAGSYEVTITDANNCGQVELITISDPSPIAFEMYSEAVSCYGATDGIISIFAAGGTSPYNYEWNNGVTEAVNDNLPEGNYIITITDANNCQSSGNFYLTQPEPIVADIATSAVSCIDAADGMITLTATGGIGTLSYLWNTGATANSLENLTPGVYLVTITDDNNCEQIELIDLPEATPFETTVDITPITCNAAADGSIAIDIAGGTGVYDFSWNTGATVNSIANLPAGTYEVTITDSNNCGHLELIDLPEPAAFTYAIAIAPVSCFEGADGSISVTASGGTGALSYLWSNGTAGNSIANLPEGIYTMTITDANNCESSEAFYVPQPAIIMLDVAIDLVSCFEGADGSISVTASGGTGDFTYEWSNGATGSMVENLPAGTYTATVTDGNNCESINTIVLSEPEQLSAGVIPTNPTSGSGGSITLIPEGGTWPHYVLWSNGATTFELNDLPAGTYTYTLTDYNGCVVDGTVVLESVNSLTDPATLDCLVYPNPSAGVVYLESDAGAMTVGVYDVLGRLQREFSRAQAVAVWPLDLSGLGAGVYALRIEVEGVILVRKVVLE
jgi:uncharacterized repeat protein (TIGR02543 family)